MSSKEEYLNSYESIRNGYYKGSDVLNFKNLIEEHYELKEKYSKILDDVHDYRYETHCMKMTIRNLCEHFEVESEKELQNIYLNKPYKFEDLQEGMWVWDDEYKQCIKIKLVFMPCKEYQKGSLKIYHNLNEDNDLDFVEFEENRFFPVNVGCEHD